MREIIDWSSFASFMQAFTERTGHMPPLDEFRKAYGPKVPRRQFREWAHRWWQDNPRIRPNPNDKVSKQPSRYRVMPTQGVTRNWTVFDYWDSDTGYQVAHFREDRLPHARRDAEQYADILESGHRLEQEYQAALKVVNAHVRGLPKRDVIDWAADLKQGKT